MNLPLLNVAGHLAGLAEREPHRAAVVVPNGRDRLGRVTYSHLTFSQLHQESDVLAHGLRDIGIDRGTRTVLMVTPGIDFFALTFALFKLGAVPVLVDPGMGIRNLGTCLGEAEPEAFIGIPKAHVARKILGWGRNTLRVTVSTRRRFPLAMHSIRSMRAESKYRSPFAIFEPTWDDVAAILFTSGSTGIAKGVVYTHGIFAAQVELLRETYGIQPGEIDLATFPLFALFGPALGMTAIVPDMDATRPASVDPEKIREAIDNFGVTNLFGSPALLDRVGRAFGADGTKFPSLKRVISAGAPVPARVIERFSRCLRDDVQVFTPYGATESLPVASIGSHEILAETRHETERGCGVCVGRPVNGMTVRVIAINPNAIAQFDESMALEPGQIGEICVRGPVVTRSYYNRDEATRLAKMQDAILGETWHRMGDVGYLDDSGRLWFCGRKAHIVETAMGRLFTIPCEAIFNQHPAVKRSAMVGVEGRPVICVELDPEAKRQSESDLDDELRRLAEAHPHTREIRKFLVHPKFPVDIRHNSKIFREKLAVWAGRLLNRKRWSPSILESPIPHPPVFKGEARR